MPIGTPNIKDMIELDIDILNVTDKMSVKVKSIFNIKLIASANIFIKMLNYFITPPLALNVRNVALSDKIYAPLSAA